MPNSIRHALVLYLLAPALGAQVSEEAKLVGSSASDDDFFGRGVDISGDTAVVGAWADAGRGTAYVFERAGASWLQTQKLNPIGGAAFDYIGFDVGIDGDVIAVCAQGDDDNGSDAGAVYVFERTGGGFVESAKLLAGDGTAGDIFGRSVAVDGDTVLVGAHQADSTSAVDSGAAYVFVRMGAVWIQQAKLEPFDGAPEDDFGWSVALQADAAIVGARSADGVAAESGSAYVFVRSGSTWSFESKLEAGDGATGDGFGEGVAISGDQALVGAPDDDHAAGTRAGAVYAWERVGGSWSLEARITATDAAAFDRFGFDVAIQGTWAVVGAPGDDLNGPASGSAYLFEHVAAWTQVAEFAGNDTQSIDWLGESVAMEAGALIVGASMHDGGGDDEGAAYVFRLDPPPAPGFGYCPGDVAGACPCANESATGAGAGCANSTGTGALLAASGSASVGADDLEFSATQLLRNQPALLFVGENAVNQGDGSPFGDGLRCAGGGVRRLGVGVPDATGGVGYGPGLSTLGMWSPGDTRRFQVWYRDPTGSPCLTGFNLTNGFEVLFDA